MSTPIVPEITSVGLDAAFNAHSTGIAAEIAYIALGDAAYTPDREQTALQSEQMRIPVSAGQKVSATQIRIEGIADGSTEFFVQEVGFILSDGTLLAVWSHETEKLAYKSSRVDLLLALDLVLDTLPADSITINAGVASYDLTLAEELVKIATVTITNSHRTMQQALRLQALENAA